MSDVKEEISSATNRAHHMTAKSRAIDDNISPNTEIKNGINLTALRAKKIYKTDVIRIHMKGSRSVLSDTTSGVRLGGSKTKRGSWHLSQKRVSRRLSLRLLKQPGFIGAKHLKGTHGSEIAHARPQHAGGLTDPLGAQPASVHSNIEDMAREQGQAKLYRKYGENVRMKTTIYVHDGGEFQGAVKASMHKYYLLSSNGVWEKKGEHLQDGLRGNINKSEAENIERKISSLSPLSPTIQGSKGLNLLSDIKDQINYRPNKKSLTQNSPYFTDVAVGSGLGQRQVGNNANNAVLATLEQ
ncbi:hypothetical protein ACO0K0_07740 [Undibacterium sp. SXout11W]|uniref:hypothetical protein n=1 Tax=Undibacterium sp. SXout11W TaxID=3413050 RepID=UPI003BF3351F